jgi:hypothetical protein
MWFFSRVLGSDAYLPPSPPQRPFSAVEVWASMLKQPRGTGNRATDPSNPGTVLMLSQFGAEASILVPSIRNMAVDEAKRELHLFGEFGDVAGDVTVSGTTAAPMSWNQTEVVVLIPDVGAGSMGDTVAKARNQSSNAAPLTSWVGTSRLRHTFNGTYGPPGPWYELDCSRVHFRADIHPWRFEPDGNAVAGTTFFSDVYDSRILIGNLTQDSECSGQAAAFGDKTDGATTVRYGFTMPKRALPWADQEATPPNNWFFGFGHIDPVARRLLLGTSSLADAPNGQWLQRIAPDPPSDVVVFTIPFSSAAANDVLIKRPPHPLDAQFGVTRHTDLFDVPFGPWVDTGLAEVELTAEPSTLPDGNTPG